MSDAVHHPKHYNTGRIEVIEFLEDQKLGLHLGSAVKYICRAGKKDPTKKIEDLEKGLWYLQRKLELLRAKRDKRRPVRPNDMNRERRVSSVVNVMFHDPVVAGARGHVAGARTKGK